MAKQKLSKVRVEKLEPGEKDYIIWDADLPGFGVRVKPTGVKSYVVQYRNRQNGVSRRKTLGMHGPLLTFHQARDRARMLLADALKGADPIADGQAHRSAPTMLDLASEYLERHAVPKKRPKSVANDRSMLARLVLPRLGGKKVVDVKAQEIHALHVAMRETPYQANRVLALLSKMFSLATEWGWRQDNPTKGVKRFAEEPRDRWLSDGELLRLFEILTDHPNQRAANAVRLQLLTGARLGEVLTACWTDFDLARAVWTKPSHHTKQKRREHVPLSAASMALLTEMREAAIADAVHLFPGDSPGKPLQSIKKFWAGILKVAGLEDYRLHDNRHTHASHLVSSGLSLEIVGRLLGHTNPITTRRYAHIADDPLRAATERFGTKIDHLVEGGKGTKKPNICL